MGRRVNRGQIIGQIMAFCRERPDQWQERSMIAAVCKISDTLAWNLMKLIGENEPDFEFHKGELRRIEP